MSLENAGDFEYQAKKARLSLGLLRSLRRQFTEGFRLRGRWQFSQQQGQSPSLDPLLPPG